MERRREKERNEVRLEETKKVGEGGRNFFSYKKTFKEVKSSSYLRSPSSLCPKFRFVAGNIKKYRRLHKGKNTTSAVARHACR